MSNYTISGINDKLKLPFELFSIDIIVSRLEKLKGADNNPISNFYQLDEATRSKIRKHTYQENARFFAYIKFCNVNGDKYGLESRILIYKNKVSHEKDKKIYLSVTDLLICFFYIMRGFCFRGEISSETS